VTPKVFELLTVLVRAGGRALPRRELIDSVWSDVVVEEGNLDWNISALRKALSETPGAVETVRGFGYRFALPVRVEAPGSGTAEPPPSQRTAPASIEAPPAPEHGAGRDEETRERPTGTDTAVRRRRLVAGVAVLALALFAAIAALRSRREGPRRPAAAPQGAPTVAVVPFENLSRAAESAWLSTALREVVSSEIARGGVETVAGDSVARALSGGLPVVGSELSQRALEPLRDELGADLVVAGAFLALPGGGLRVDLRLQDARNGASLLAWTDSGRVDDLLALVGRAGAELRRKLPVSAPPERASSSTYAVSTAALRAYTEGLDLLRASQPREARARFEAALAESPGFALARVRLSDALDQLGYEQLAAEEGRRAQAAALDLPREERLEIEARGMELAGDWQGAVEREAELTRLLPGSLDHGLRYATVLSRAGRHDDSGRELERLAALPPPKGNDPRIDLQRGWTARFAGDFATMRAAGERAAAAGERAGRPLVTAEGLFIESWGALSLGDFEASLSACERGRALAAAAGNGLLGTSLLGVCAWARWNRGDLEGAGRDFQAGYDLAVELGDLRHRAGHLNGLTVLAGGSGDLDRALELSREALEVSRSCADRETEVNALHLLARYSRLKGEIEAADAFASEGLPLARATNVASRIANLLDEYGFARAMRGDVKAGVEALEESVRIQPMTNPGRVSSRKLALAGLRIHARDFDGALALIDEIERDLSGKAQGKDVQDQLDLVRALALGHSGATAEAGRLADRLLPWVEPIRAFPQGADFRLTLAGVLDDAGRRAEARRLHEEILAEPSWRPLGATILESEYELARFDAEERPGSDTEARLAEVTARVRAAKFGLLLGEVL